MRATKEVYGDNAVGYVQVQRDGDVCTVQAKITPEHRVRNSPYIVEILLNEKEEKVLHSVCKDCSASAGGCKHEIAFLFWLHRRSEEPSCTSTTSYWKKSVLADIGNAKVDLQSLLKEDLPVLGPPNNIYVSQSMKICSENKVVFTVRGSKDKYTCIDQLWFKFKTVEKREQWNVDNFINYMRLNMSDYLCLDAEKDTRMQANSPLWHSLRFGRINVSKFHEAAHCKTIDGSYGTNKKGLISVTTRMVFTCL